MRAPSSVWSVRRRSSSSTPSVRRIVQSPPPGTTRPRSLAPSKRPPEINAVRRVPCGTAPIFCAPSTATCSVMSKREFIVVLQSLATRGVYKILSRTWPPEPCAGAGEAGKPYIPRLLVWRDFLIALGVSRPRYSHPARSTRREHEIDPQSRESGRNLVPAPLRHRPPASHVHSQQAVRVRERDRDGQQHRRSRVALSFRHRGRPGLW